MFFIFASPFSHFLTLTHISKRPILNLYSMTLFHRPASLLITVVMILLSGHSPIGATNPSSAPSPLTVEATLDSLDHLINERYRFSQKKEKEIQKLKLSLKARQTAEQQFQTLGYLIDAYRAFSIDSQTVYVKRQIALADNVKNHNMQVQARLNMVECLYNAGMYKEADELLMKVGRNSLPDYILPYYYHLKRTLYGLLADYALEPEIRNGYNKQLNLYRDSILQTNSSNTFTYSVVKADELTERHDYAEALEILRKALYQGSLNSHDRGIVYYCMAEVFAQTQQNDSSKIYYALSAQCDLKAAVREYVSLHRLAEQLFREGDIERAYSYIKCSVEDARACNARVRSLEFMPVFTIIEEVYQAHIQKQRKLSITFTYITCAFCIILLITFVILFFQNHKLNIIKEKLNQTNQHLQTVNDSLTESNHVKEEYLSRYMDHCAVYIDKMDDYRRSLNKLASLGKIEELNKNLKSQNLITNERKMFYAEFDQSFLKLYPNFVEKFNELLIPEARITPKPNSLTPELRIYALVRLGTTDSVKIARFLCYSVSTIYNYRVKIRNSAIGSRDDFEERVMHL